MQLCNKFNVYKIIKRAVNNSCVSLARIILAGRNAKLMLKNVETRNRYLDDD